MIVEVMRIDGGSHHWINRINNGFGKLIQDLVMMVMVNLVMIKRV